MANVRKKVINKWDGGIKTSSRDSNPNTSDGFQMVKGFDVYKDSKKASPMQSWEDFTTDTEKAYNIRAMGGQSDTVYGLGSGLSNWYGRNWDYRIRVDVTGGYLWGATGFPIRLDMSTLPQDFWDNTEDDFSDVRCTKKDGVTIVNSYIENYDKVGLTGDLWLNLSNVAGSMTTIKSETPNATSITSIQEASNSIYAFAMPVTLNNKTINSLQLWLYRVGTPPSATVSIYSDNAGTPDTLVQTLGTIDATLMTKSTSGSVYNLGFDDITLDGNYWIVVKNTSYTSGNYIAIKYGSSGSMTVKSASNSGLTSWSNVSTSAAPYYVLGYTPPSYFYIYYGYNTTGLTNIPYGSTAFPYTNQRLNTFTGGSMSFFYTFADSQTYGKVEGSDWGGFTTNPTFADGLFGKAAQTNGVTIQTDQDEEVVVGGADMSVSMLVYLPSIPGTQTTILDDSNGNFHVKVNNTGVIECYANGSTGDTNNTSTDTIPTGEWTMIDFVFDGDAYIYINGRQEYFGIADGNHSTTNTNNYLRLNTINGKIGMIMGFANDLSQTSVTAKLSAFSNNIFSAGTQETQSSVSLQYDGTQMYQKLISSGDWIERVYNGQPLRVASKYPVNAFIDDTGDYFIISNEPENQAFWYLAKIDPYGVIDDTHLLLTVLTSNPSKIVSTQEFALGDGTTYFNFGNSYLGSIGDPGSTTEQAFSSTVVSMASWRSYMAVGYMRRNRARIDIWDLVSTIVERLDAGTGNVRIVGTAGDTLFCVVDNFVDDATKSANKPTVEIRQYVGNGQTEKTHVLEIPTVITSYDDDWERAVSPFKINRNTQTLFYMRLPKDSTGTTFNEGFWAVGRNSDGRLSLTLQIDTEGLGMPENVFGFAQQVFFIQKDGGIKKLSDSTYDNTALITTLKMNEGNTEIEKKLHGIEIVTEPLEANQTISIYFKKNGDNTRTKICDMTGEGEISKEAMYDIDGYNLGNYKEIEFDIESTGGKSAILEFNYKYEYLSDIV